METFLIKAAQLIVAFMLLVIIHELGHYTFSRIFGVKVEKFYLFFNPWFTLYKYKPKKKAPRPGEKEKITWRDTEYGIGWLPLGGYCKIAGMIDESMDTEQLKQPAQPWEFRSRPAWQRLLIMIGGVLNNFILAIVIYTGIVYAWGEAYIPFRNATEGMMFSESAHRVGFEDGDIPLFADGHELETYTGDELMRMLDADVVTVLRDKKDTVDIAIPKNFIFTVNSDAENGQMFMAYRLPVVVSEVQPGMGAVKAGMMAGDSIVSVNGQAATTYEVFKALLDQNPGKSVEVGFVRDGEELTASVALDDAAKMGIMLTQITDIYTAVRHEYSILASIPRGVELGVEKLVSYVSQLKYVFTKEGAKNLGGFGAIGNIFPSTWDWEQFWSITAFLSVILAFMNILPIPALDGGHVLFLLYEIIFRRQPGEKFLEYAQMAGMLFLIALLLFANGNDIYRFFFK